MNPNASSPQAPEVGSPVQPSNGGNKWQQWKARLATKQGLGLLALAVVLLAGLAIYAANNQEKQPVSPPPAAQQAPAQAAVTIKDSGFVPSTITVKSGTQLTWTNKGKKSHQVAADPYPLNNSIEGFDSTKTLLPGDSLAFTFETPGTYHLHDQLNPLSKSFRLTVVVQ